MSWQKVTIEHAPEWEEYRVELPNGGRGFSRVGKNAAGNMLDGRQWLQMPEARQ